MAMTEVFPNEMTENRKCRLFKGPERADCLSVSPQSQLICKVICAAYKLICFFSARFMLKRAKPELVSSNSSARLLEDVVVDKDNHDHLLHSSRVRLSFSYRPISL